MNSRHHMLVVVIVGLLAVRGAAQTDDQSRAGWMKTPTVSVMTGFIY